MKRRRDEAEEEITRPVKEARGWSKPMVDWDDFKDEEGGDRLGEMRAEPSMEGEASTGVEERKESWRNQKEMRKARR